MMNFCFHSALLQFVEVLVQFQTVENNLEDKSCSWITCKYTNVLILW